MAAIVSKQDSAMKIDPSRGPESDDRGRPVDGRGGRVCLQDSAGVCDSLAGTVAVVRSAGTHHCNTGGRGRNGGKYKMPFRNSHRSVPGK